MASRAGARTPHPPPPRLSGPSRRSRMLVPATVHEAWDEHAVRSRSEGRRDDKMGRPVDQGSTGITDQRRPSRCGVAV